MHAFVKLVTLALSALAVAAPADIEKRASKSYVDNVRFDVA